MSQNRRIAVTIALLAACTGGQALAAGTVTGITPSKTTLDLGQSLTVDVTGTAQPDAFKRVCGLRIAMMYPDNSIEFAAAGLGVSYFPMTGIYVKPTKAGLVKITAEGAAVNLPGSALPACQGIRTVAVEVKTPPLVKMNNPNLSAQAENPNFANMHPMLAAATITGLKQVPYTDQGGETWLQIDGTGTCSYTVEGASLPAAVFASSAAKPFPMKVKIIGAPTGSYNWTAKGTGACTGSASGNANVHQ